MLQKDKKYMKNWILRNNSESDPNIRLLLLLFLWHSRSSPMTKAKIINSIKDI